MDKESGVVHQEESTENSLTYNSTSSSNQKYSQVSSQTRNQKSSPRVSPRTSWINSDKNSPRASSSSSSRSTLTQPVGSAKRDRGVQSGEEEDENMSLGSSSDDSHESIKKIRKDTTENEDVSQKTTQKSQLKKNEPIVLPEGKQTTKKSDHESDGAMSCDLNKESQKSKEKANKKKRNKDKKTDSKDVHEELEKMSCGRDEEEDDAFSAASSMFGSINAVTKEDSDSLPSFSGNCVPSKINHSNSNNSISNSKAKSSNNESNSKSDPPEEQSPPNPLVGGGPNKRRRSKSYRSRLQESSDEGGDQDPSERGRPAESRSPSAGSRRASSSNQTRRSSAQRRRSGELRESSTAGRSRIRRPQRDGLQEPEASPRESRSAYLARFLATDSDEESSSNTSDDDEEGNEDGEGDPPHHAVAVAAATVRPVRSSSRGRAAAARAVGSVDSGTTPVLAAAGEAQEEDVSTAAVAGRPEDESVAERVRRRRVSRGSRGSGTATSTATSAGGAATSSRREGSAGSRRHVRHRLMLRDSSSDSLSSNSDLDEDDDDDDGDSDLDPFSLRAHRRRRRRPMPDQVEKEIKAEIKAIKEKKLPKHDFNLTKEIINRQYGGGVCGLRIPGGGGSRYGLQFSQRYYSSLHTVQHLKLMSNLNHHQGCVNAIGFNNSGSVLVSGSDDLQVALWDWNREKLLMAFESGHRNNVFQCKFLPLPGDRHIVTCARDGQVRLAEVSDAVCRSTRRLAKHNGPSHKLAVTPARPQVVLSAGEDGEVKESDVRQERANTIAITTNDAGSRVALYSIHNHPLNENQFCVAGRDQYVCVYDRRITTNTAPPVLKYCPDHLQLARPRANVTCAVYSNNGDAILASYNDEDIYLFDTGESCNAPPKHKYSGHRNSATVKGVNLFGPHSQYVMSGSDCGNVFIWSRETEAIVRCFTGDDNGVVNVLEWHPHLPLLATSGLDSDVKIWIPSSDDLPKDDKLEETVENNLRERRNSSSDLVEFTDSRMITMIWDQMRRLQSNRGSEGGRRRGGGSGQQRTQERDSDSSDDDAENPFSGSRSRHLQCATQ